MQPAPFRPVTLMLLCGLLAACDFNIFPAAKIDEDWHRQNLAYVVLEPWLKASLQSDGYMKPGFSRDWQATPQGQPATSLILQARNVWAFAKGYKLTENPALYDGARKGADFMLEHFKDPVNGGWYKAVAPDGKVLDDSKELYGQAFAILALSEAYRLNRNERYFQPALYAMRNLHERMRDKFGGFHASADKNFVIRQSLNNQNPVMHLFEAVMNLYESSHNEEAKKELESIGQFVFQTLLKTEGDDRVFIPEWYDENWQPLADDKGGYIDLGHQFEWAWLLSHAALLDMGKEYLDRANKILAYALAHGYDDKEGGSFNRISSHGKLNREKGYWQQAECLRTLMHFMVVRKQTRLRFRYQQILDYIDGQWIDRQNGGWRMRALNRCLKQDCPNEQPDPYHMTAMHAEGFYAAWVQSRY